MPDYFAASSAPRHRASGQSSPVGGQLFSLVLLSLLGLAAAGLLNWVVVVFRPGSVLRLVLIAAVVLVICGVFSTVMVRRVAALRGELVRAREEARLVPEPEGVRQPKEQVAAILHVARRQHALTVRALEALNQLERGLEDPAVLDEVYRVDHLVTRMRRLAEGVSLLGGQTARRHTKPMVISAVFRQATAEIESFGRVRRVHLPEGGVVGFVAAELTHLFAELLENATRFSDPGTQVTVRAGFVPAGLSVEIDDVGLPIPEEKLTELNRLLAAPELVGMGAQLESGCLGLRIVATIAQKHGIRVVLQRNVQGGNQAVVVLPQRLLVPVEKASAPATPAPETAVAVPGSHRAGEPGAAIPGPHRTAEPVADPVSGLPRRRPAGSQTDALPRRSAASRPVVAEPVTEPSGPVADPASGLPDALPRRSASPRPLVPESVTERPGAVGIPRREAGAVAAAYARARRQAGADGRSRAAQQPVSTPFPSPVPNASSQEYS